ncbi:MAG: hypothetical protein JSR64_09620 [Nitrospira sp.]|nr:hypothetical protein [Nitrospira sp.]MBS0194347.1 hypothetical protein [Pseudomonadota bacterium]
MKRSKKAIALRMHLITKTDLDLLVDHTAIERVHVTVSDTGRWFAVFHVKKVSGKVEAYRIVTQRHEPREWANPKILFQFLLREYNVASGTFLTTPMPASDSGIDRS